MRTIFFAILTLVLITCKKNDTTPAVVKKMEATIVYSNGNIVKINEANQEVSITTGYGFTTFKCTNSLKQSVILNVYTAYAPGNYDLFDCFFYTNNNLSSAPIYQNALGPTAGSVTYTKYDYPNVEGYFETPCDYQLDTVLVTGTFKGTMN